MGNSHLFYKYYDTLFATKDYAGEVAAVFRYCAGYPLQPLENILECGCGTGRHTLELAGKPGVHVTAVDIDREMLALAKKRTAKARQKNITFAPGVDAVRDVDLCVALFNVVNYIRGEENLHTFFAEIAASLRLQGMFIFDCWNGSAALKDPPGSKKYEQERNGELVSCLLTGHTDIIGRETTLEYQLDIFDRCDHRLASGKYEIVHHLWTPAEIKEMLTAAGFELLTVCQPFNFEQEATDSDWKMMFACRKR